MVITLTYIGVTRSFSRDLEQVHVIRMFCRGLRLEMVAILGMALAVPALAAANSQATQTRLSAETSVRGGSTQATMAVTVLGNDGQPAGGAVVIEDGGTPLAGAALSAEGHARLQFALPAGDHSLRAVYKGDTTHLASASEPTGIRAQATAAAPDFQVSVAPASISLTAGQAGSAIVSVTPVNAGGLTAPMFVTLSCSGFPDQSSCNFTPENVEIQPSAAAATTSSMVITTQATSLAGITPSTHPGSPVALAILLPGTLALAGFAFSVRRRRWLNRISLVALVGFVSVLGATACAPRYNYYNHGPPHNLPTPSGTYTLQVTAQSSNGIIATTHTTTFALTVK
jgi:hypothetical protein